MRNLTTIIATLFLLQTSFAQSPASMGYQAVIRDASNVLVDNQAIGMRISILQGSATGSAVYVETQTPNSNDNGLVTIQIGDGTNVSGNFSTIDWSNGPFFVKTETDPTGGTSYTITGTSQLMSVPYALHATTADSISGPTAWTINGDHIYSSQSGNVGIGTTGIPNSKMYILNDEPAVTTFKNSTSGQGAFSQFYNSDESIRGIIGVDGAGYSGTSDQFSISTWTNHPIDFRTNTQSRMLIDETGNVGIGTTSPDASALLDLSSTSKGVLVPRMTEAERDVISSPSNGLMIYQTDNSPGHYFYNGSVWKSVGGSDVPSSGIVLSETENNTELTDAGFSLIGDFLVGNSSNRTGYWSAMSTTNQPSARSHHSTIWTGDKMIIWGGNFSGLGTGGLYDPNTDTWTATSTTNAPTTRGNHIAVWTGSTMIIWGGENHTTGGIYDPDTDIWTSMSTTNAPNGSERPLGVWTGEELIVWGSTSSASGGGIYNPDTDTWTTISTVNQPPNDNDYDSHSLWTGNQMLVFHSNTVSTYNPIEDNWTTLNSNAGSFGGNINVSPTLIGTKVFFAEGYTTKIFDLATNTSSSINDPNAITIQPSVWTGAQLIGAGGGKIFVFDFVHYSWSELTTYELYSYVNSSLIPDGLHKAKGIWTGTKFLSWGPVYQSGLIYDPNFDDKYYLYKKD